MARQKGGHPHSRLGTRKATFSRWPGFRLPSKTIGAAMTLCHAAHSTTGAPGTDVTKITQTHYTMPVKTRREHHGTA